MRSVQKFFICKHCGNIIGLVINGDSPMTCCDEKMEELEPNTAGVDSGNHLPVITADRDKVTVRIGKTGHPMTPDHFIAWIYLETEHGGQRKALAPGELPEAVFALYNDRPLAAYAYCNESGLWKTVIE